VQAETPGPGALGLTLSAEAAALAEDTVGQGADDASAGGAAAAWPGGARATAARAPVRAGVAVPSGTAVAP
jgi:hypothetical protein